MYRFSLPSSGSSTCSVKRAQWIVGPALCSLSWLRERAAERRRKTCRGSIRVSTIPVMIIRQAHLANQRCCCLLWLPAPGRRAFDDDSSSDDDPGDGSFHTLVAIVATMRMGGLGGETIWLYYKNKWQITAETKNAGLARPSGEAQTKNAEDMAERQTDSEHSLCTPPHEIILAHKSAQSCLQRKRAASRQEDPSKERSCASWRAEAAPVHARSRLPVSRA